jgi:hypothetical protein
MPDNSPGCVRACSGWDAASARTDTDGVCAGSFGGAISRMTSTAPPPGNQPPPAVRLDIQARKTYNFTRMSHRKEPLVVIYAFPRRQPRPEPPPVSEGADDGPMTPVTAISPQAPPRPLPPDIKELHSEELPF